ncbi:MAG: sulfotransferase [Anaerolineales bacterium]|nr:sulfotransferase [Anaerolineales bacterium]
MNTPLRDRPVFICGHPKSGTSLLRNVLDSHPELVVYPEETGFFRRYLPEVQGQALAEKISRADESLLHIFQWNQAHPPEHQNGFPDRDYSKISYEAVQDAFHARLTQEPVRHDGDLLSAAVLAYGSVVGQLGPQTRHWVEKSTYNERFAGQIYSWWPEAVCIHIVRDPRDNYLSYQRKHPEWKAETFATSWIQSTREGLRNSARYESYRILRYEDLVSEPQERLEELCEFLDIRFADSMQTPSRAGQAWPGNSMFDVSFQEIEASAAGRWKNALTASEAGLLWQLAKTEMQALDYTWDGEVPWESYVREAKWRVHAFFKTRGGNS